MLKQTKTATITMSAMLIFGGAALYAEPMTVSFVDPVINADQPVGVGFLGVQQLTALDGAFTFRAENRLLGSTFFRRTQFGLGIVSGDFDEIDIAVGDVMRVAATGGQDYYMHAFQIRSLFLIGVPDPPERASAAFYLNGSLVQTINMIGTGVPFTGPNPFGISGFDFGAAPLQFDEFELFVTDPPGELSHGFTFGAMQVTQVPEPSAIFLLGAGALVALTRLRRR